MMIRQSLEKQKQEQKEERWNLMQSSDYLLSSGRVKALENAKHDSSSCLFEIDSGQNGGDAIPKVL